MENKNIFIFDKNKCVACGACKVACINENGFQHLEQWRNIHSSNSNHYPDLAVIHLSMACNHCDDSPCLTNCPALAYTRDNQTGAVLHHPEKCIGCKYCTWTCPYDAPKYNPKEGIVSKCTFCVERIKEMEKPACANLCPTGALDFGEEKFSREESIKSTPVPVDVGSKIKIVEPRNINAPEMDLTLFDNKRKPEEKKSEQKITAIKEWPLLCFTYLIALVAGIVSSGILSSTDNVTKSLVFSLTVFASVLSTLHLGQKFRSWRSILNLKGSWISREILFLGFYTVVLFFDFFLFKISEFILIFTAVALLVSVDMLYGKAMWKWKVKVHPGQTLFISLGLMFLLSGNFILAGTVYLFRVIISFFTKDQNLGLVLLKNISLFTGIFFCLTGEMLTGVLLVSLFDIWNRIEFYNSLRLPEISS